MDGMVFVFLIPWTLRTTSGRSEFFLPSFCCPRHCANQHALSWKRKGEQYDDRVVEVVWDKERQTWKMLRFRDDKREGNYKTVVTSILRSIEHGVEADEVRSFSVVHWDF